MSTRKTPGIVYVAALAGLAALLGAVSIIILSNMAPPTYTTSQIDSSRANG